MNHVRIWAKTYDDLVVDGLKHSQINKDWTTEKRFELVTKVLAGHSITSVVKNAHIDSGQLYQWVKKITKKVWMVYNVMKVDQLNNSLLKRKLRKQSYPFLNKRN